VPCSQKSPAYERPRVPCSQKSPAYERQLRADRAAACCLPRAQAALRATRDSFAALTLTLRKSLARHLAAAGAQDAEAPGRAPLTSAAHALIEAAAAAEAHADSLEHRFCTPRPPLFPRAPGARAGERRRRAGGARRVAAMAVGEEVRVLARSCKQARKAGARALDALGVTSLGAADKDAAAAAQRRAREEVEGAVRRMEVHEWRTKPHVDAWAGLVSARADAALPPEAPAPPPRRPRCRCESLCRRGQPRQTASGHLADRAVDLRTKNKS
jgi:hypothetical protein